MSRWEIGVMIVLVAVMIGVTLADSKNSYAYAFLTGECSKCSTPKPCLPLSRRGLFGGYLTRFYHCPPTP